MPEPKWIRGSRHKAHPQQAKQPDMAASSVPHRILILTSDAGSGHRSAAGAIEAALNTRYGDACQVTILNPLHLPKAPTVLRVAEQTYLDQVKHVPELYQLQYEATDSLFLASLINLGAAKLLQGALVDLLKHQPADVVIQVYPIFGKAVLAACKQLSRRIPLATVVTDLISVHGMWFDRSVDLCLVPTDAVSEKAFQYGLSPKQVKVVGLPVHPRFSEQPASRVTLRGELGWHVERPTVLVLGGGAGVGAIFEIVREVALRCPYAQIAVVAGRNEKLRHKLLAQSWPIPTQIYGFTDQMPALMHAADVLVTKAGGLSVSEGLACGRPLIIYEVIPGQEEGNLAYVLTHDVGVYAPSASKVADVLSRWFQPDNEELDFYAANARETGHPRAADRIAVRVWMLARGS